MSEIEPSLLQDEKYILRTKSRSEAELERFYARAQRYAGEDGRYADQQVRRDRLAKLGSYSMILALMKIANSFSLSCPVDIQGGDNLPKTGAGVINAVHQDGDDAALVLSTAVESIGRCVSPLVEIDSGQTWIQYTALEILDVVWQLRGFEPLARNRQKQSFDEMLKKSLDGKLLAAWSEGTFCPDPADVLDLYAGSSTKLTQKFYELTGEKMMNYPEVTAFEFDRETGNPKIAHVEYLDPFDSMDSKYFRNPEVIKPEHAAAEALRQRLRAKKIAMYREYMPDMTPEQYSRFRASSQHRHPKDPDYYDRGHFSLNFYKAAMAGDEEAMTKVLMTFADKPTV